MNSSIPQPLQSLARRYRVLTRYRDGFKQFRTPSVEAVVEILRQMGAPIERPEDAPAAVQAAARERWSALLPPCAVIWQADPAPSIEVRTELAAFSTPGQATLTLESGEQSSFDIAPDSWSLRGRCQIDGTTYIAARLPLPATPPPGYHRLTLTLGGRTAETALLAAPNQCYLPDASGRTWGVFLPVYSLRTDRGDGVGDFSALGDLLAWARSLGGSLAGTLPLLAAYLDEPFEYSPYVPVSRLFWNELYIDPRKTPEWEAAADARAAYERASDPGQRNAPLVDYEHIARGRRSVLERLSQAAWNDPERKSELEAWVAARPDLQSYARFRATVEKRRETWRSWPERMRSGNLQPEDARPDAERYHLYAQFTADRQLAQLGALYLDLPLGVHPGGFDVWRQPDSFADGVAGGAPPDRFFTQGQNWGFAPLHPEAGRRDGHAHFRACLRHHMQHSALLRIDHFMGLHRLYWIPKGAQASEGTYVQYPAEELYAVVAIESQRARARVVGEDLGTVPKYVRRRMRERAIDRMYVAQFSFKPDLPDPVEPPSADSLAGVNTHDTPTFAAFWQGLDIDLQLELNLLNEEEAKQARLQRADARVKIASGLGVPEQSDRVLEALLERLGASEARAVMVNLEDLWDETAPQNTPGTGQEMPNWRRRARYSLAEIEASDPIRRILEKVAQARKR